ncbi:MAG TPA: hypothetical protein VFF68_08435 [Anaerolineaceae bacterium]|nr:hypothetical protein [Anaerolineaceae bacterium]
MNQWLKQQNWKALLIFTLLNLFFAILLAYNPNDDSYITYRHAQNLVLGRGFVFNPGEKLLGTTAPLHGLILGLLGFVYPNFPFWASAISLVASILLSYTIFLLLKGHKQPIAAWIAGLLVIFGLSTHYAYPLETILLTALSWGAIYAYWKDRFAWVAVFSALAVLTRSDAAFLVVSIFLMDLLLRKDLRKLIRSGFLAVALTVPWFLFSYFYYRSIFPNTAATKTGWVGHEFVFLEQLLTRGVYTNFSNSIIGGGVLIIAAAGLIRLFTRDWKYLRVIPLWMAIYLIAYTGMQIFWPHTWYYYPITISISVLFALGMDTIASQVVDFFKRRSPHVRWIRILVYAFLFTGVACLFILNTKDAFEFRERIPYTFFNGGRDRLYKTTADWLVEHTPPDATVAYHEPGTIAYYSDRKMIDMVGLVTSGVGDEMKRTNQPGVSIDWTIENFHPDVFLQLKHKGEDYEKFLDLAKQYELITKIEFEEVEYFLLLYERK